MDELQLVPHPVRLADELVQAIPPALPLTGHARLRFRIRKPLKKIPCAIGIVLILGPAMLMPSAALDILL